MTNSDPINWPVLIMIHDKLTSTMRDTPYVCGGEDTDLEPTAALQVFVIATHVILDTLR